MICGLPISEGKDIDSKKSHILQVYRFECETPSGPCISTDPSSGKDINAVLKSLLQDKEKNARIDWLKSSFESQRQYLTRNLKESSNDQTVYRFSRMISHLHSSISFTSNESRLTYWCKERFLIDTYYTFHLRMSTGSRAGKWSRCVPPLDSVVSPFLTNSHVIYLSDSIDGTTLVILDSKTGRIQEQFVLDPALHSFLPWDVPALHDGYLFVPLSETTINDRTDLKNTSTRLVALLAKVRL